MSKFSVAVWEELNKIGYREPLLQEYATSALEKLAREMVAQVIQEHREEIEEVLKEETRKQIEQLKSNDLFVRQAIANGVWDALRRDG